MAKNLYSITPVLTLFVPQDGTDSTLLKQPEARLTCLKGTGLTDAAIATMKSTDENKDSAADMMASPKLVALGLAMGFSLWVLA